MKKPRNSDSSKPQSPSKHVSQELRRVASAAAALDKVLWRNAGDNADWPVNLSVRGDDKVTAMKLARLLNNLRSALEKAGYEVEKKDPKAS